MSLPKLLKWTPLALGAAFVIFLSLFALDSRSVPEFLVHLIPSFILILVLLLSWRWPLVGALVFAGAGILYWVRNLAHPSWIWTISGPALGILVLLFSSWILPRVWRKD